MKLLAKRNHPHYLINRKIPRRFFKNSKRRKVSNSI
jgi:hypothetical protein